ncbi:hypothetical protein LOD99_11377 [Oopsacas minuta]|uniref:Uncharacterized protein n=1 Tax=Oopsacas minuta TaxID=111878 RepID=A0AAV7K324_9METZ|nr:hypothetical protein LOD99_11377 [Oopsacas minuta]
MHGIKWDINFLTPCIRISKPDKDILMDVRQPFTPYFSIHPEITGSIEFLSVLYIPGTTEDVVKRGMGLTSDDVPNPPFQSEMLFQSDNLGESESLTFLVPELFFSCRKRFETDCAGGSIVDDCNVLVRDSRISDVIKYFTRNEPISGIFQFALLGQEELVSVLKLSRGRFAEGKDILGIFRKIHTLEGLFLSFDCKKETDNQGQVLISLHPKVFAVLSWVMKRLEALYSIPTRKLVLFKPTESLNYS